MARETYTIERKIISSNAWQTPAEAQAYYGRYSRDDLIAHWWGEPGKVGTHDQTVAYIEKAAKAGTMSAHFVVSDAKITMLVDPANVSWGAQGGNPTGINVEHDPTLGDEGYRKAGWLKWYLEQLFGKQLAIKKHSDYFATACPGTLDTGRIERECAALKNGGELMTEEDAKEAYRATLHREPENDLVWRGWVGKSFSQFSKAVRGSTEWLTQNHSIAYFRQREQTIAELRKQVGSLSDQDKQKLEDAYTTLGKLLKK